MIFLDTGAFVALHRKSDQWHTEARRGFVALRESSQRLATSVLVVAEAARLLAALFDVRWAAQRVEAWLSSTALQVLRSDREVELEAASLMRKYADQDVGFVDCVSFVLMRRHGIERVFGFDRHFTVGGFELWPGVHSRGRSGG